MQKRYNAEEFVRVWLEAADSGKGQQWVAEKLGVSKQTVSQRAYLWRTRGVELPPLRQYNSIPRQEVVNLNRIINER